MEAKVPLVFNPWPPKQMSLDAVKQPDRPACHQPGSACAHPYHGNKMILVADSTASLVTLGLNGLALGMQ